MGAGYRIFLDGRSGQWRILLTSLLPKQAEKIPNLLAEFTAA
jgi:hypothetical protein